MSKFLLIDTPDTLFDTNTFSTISIENTFDTLQILEQQGIEFVCLSKKKFLEVFQDVVTGLPGKEIFYTLLKQQISLVDRGHIDRFTLAMMDLDNFKSVNDTCGHLFGDRVLTDFVKSLKLGLRESDVVFRFGGDEFGVLFPNTSELQAKLVVDRLRPCTFNFSCGLYEVKADDYGDIDTWEDVVRNSDLCLYSAKELGKKRTVTWKEREEIL